MKKKKILMFDFDGVLVDSFNISFESSLASNHMSKSLKLYRSLFNGNVYDGLKNAKLQKRKNVDFFSIYEPKLMELSLSSQAKKILAQLSKKYLLLIVSSTPGGLIKTFLKQHSVLKYFKKTFGSEFHRSKVYKINFILKKYRALPKDCLFITDTLGDILEAKQCGVEAIALTGGFHLKSVLKKGRPIKIIANLGKLPKEVNNYLY